MVYTTITHPLTICHNVHMAWFCEVSVAYTKGLLLAWGHTYNCIFHVLGGHDPTFFFFVNSATSTTS